MIREHDMVTLLEDLPEHGLHAGARGTVVLILKGDAGYLVEFDGPAEEPEIVSLCPNQFRTDSTEAASTAPVTVHGGRI